MAGNKEKEEIQELMGDVYMMVEELNGDYIYLLKSTLQKQYESVYPRMLTLEEAKEIHAAVSLLQKRVGEHCAVCEELLKLKDKEWWERNDRRATTIEEVKIPDDFYEKECKRYREEIKEREERKRTKTT
jgi:hypothetical protein